MKFRTTIRQEGKSATGIPVPADVAESLSSQKRIPVQVTINNHSYRSTVVVYGGEFMIPLSAEHRTAAGIAAGEEVEVTLELDTAPREVEVPPDFAEVLDREPDAKRFFEGLSYSNQRRFVVSVEGAKTAETRQKRIDKAMAALREGRSS